MSSFAHGIVCTGKATKKSNLTFQTFVKSVCVFSLFVFAKFVFVYLWKLNDKGDLTFQMFVSSPNNAGPRQARRLFWPARHLSPVHHQCHHVTPDQTLSNRHDSVPPAQLNSAELSWTQQRIRNCQHLFIQSAFGVVKCFYQLLYFHPRSLFFVCSSSFHAFTQASIWYWK